MFNRRLPEAVCTWPQTMIFAQLWCRFHFSIMQVHVRARTVAS